MGEFTVKCAFCDHLIEVDSDEDNIFEVEKSLSDHYQDNHLGIMKEMKWKYDA